MKLEDVINAWNSQADEYNHWQTTGSDEAVEFALLLFKKKIRWMVTDLMLAYHYTDRSSISVENAIDHIMEELG